MSCVSKIFIQFFIFSILFANNGDCFTKSEKPFDYLMYTTIYPTAVCQADDDSVPESCEIPPELPKWTIHGLWPNYENRSYPQYCNATPKHFDEKMILSIEPELRKVWPNLYPKKSIVSFWKHEYDKHGTCAQSNENMKNEFLYFSQIIKIHNSLKIWESLSTIGPSNYPISKNQLNKALEPVTSGKRIEFHCLKDKKTKQFLLADLRICLDLDLKIRDCPDKNDLNRVKFVKRSTRKSNQQLLPVFQPCPSTFIYLPSTMKYEKYNSNQNNRVGSSFKKFWFSLFNKKKSV